METVKLYILSQHEEIKGFVVAKNIMEATRLFQAQADADTAGEEYFRDFALGSLSERWVIEVRENYKGTGTQRGMSRAIVAETYDVFEFDFVIGAVYGAI